MSATKRGGKRSPADDYPTPDFCTRRIVETLDLPKGRWYEPCAGEGAIIHAVEDKISGLTWFANEPRLEAMSFLCELVSEDRITRSDYLRLDACPNDVSVVITNPPFRIAEGVIHKTLSVFPRAHVVLLLRLEFIAPASKNNYRHNLMTTYAPDIYVLPNRPGFREDTGKRAAKKGSTDSSEYAWLHWKPAPRARRSGKCMILPLTPLAERKRSAALVAQIVRSQSAIRDGESGLVLCGSSSRSRVPG